MLEQFCGWSSNGFRFQPWIELAEHIECTGQDLRWVHWQRYSTRQQRRHGLPGFVGTVRLENVPEPLRPLLAVGERIHVGKSASFGMGQYRIC